MLASYMYPKTLKEGQFTGWSEKKKNIHVSHIHYLAKVFLVDLEINFLNKTKVQ